HPWTDPAPGGRNVSRPRDLLPPGRAEDDDQPDGWYDRRTHARDAPRGPDSARHTRDVRRRRADRATQPAQRTRRPPRRGTVARSRAGRGRLGLGARREARRWSDHRDVPSLRRPSAVGDRDTVASVLSRLAVLAVFVDLLPG